MRGIVQVVTGAGKTLFAEMCMQEFRERFHGAKCFIIVPTLALLDQWFVSLREDLSVPDTEIACFSGEGKSDRVKAVNLFVINTARKIADFMGSERATFLIVDECHRAGSLVNSQAVTCPHTATLGLSATPEREHDEGFQEYLVPSLGNIIFSYDYRAAYRDGVIVPFKLINVRIDLLSDELKSYRKLTMQAARAIDRLEKEGGSSDTVRRLLFRRSALVAKATMRIPVAAKLIEQNRGARTLVFHERIECAENLLSVLRQRKHSATIYNTRVSPVIRRDNLLLYRRGLFDVLISCRALDEGTNVPETTVAIIASATASQRQRIQRLGRVLRPSQGKKTALVYTIYATDAEEERLRKEAVTLEPVASVEWYKSRGKASGQIAV